MVSHRVVSVLTAAAAVLLAVVVTGIEGASVGKETDFDAELSKLNAELEEQLQVYVIAQWNQGSNITDENEAALVSCHRLIVDITIG